MWHDELPGDPGDDVVARILEASTPGPAILAQLTTTKDQGPPRPGEIWRIGRDEALLVWVRRVFDDAADVIPAVLDVDFSDQESVLVPAEATALGVPLALLTGVRSHVGLPAMLQRIGYADVSAQVEEVMMAARKGRHPEGVETGSPIESGDDPRIEYRQVIADILADLAPSRWAADPPGDSGNASTAPDAEITAIADYLSGSLPDRHPHTRVRPMPSQRQRVTDRVSLHACARVDYLDASLIVAVTDPPCLALRDTSSLASACAKLMLDEPNTTAIAITELRAGWPTIIARAADLQPAYEIPAGRKARPRISGDPLPVIEALGNFLGNARPQPGDAARLVVAGPQMPEIRHLATQNAVAAVADINEQGSAAESEAKRAAWTNLPARLIEQIVSIITGIWSSEPIDKILKTLIPREL
jgi:hypothetical protein